MRKRRLLREAAVRRESLIKLRRDIASPGTLHKSYAREMLRPVTEADEHLANNLTLFSQSSIAIAIPKWSDLHVNNYRHQIPAFRRTDTSI